MKRDILNLWEDWMPEDHETVDYEKIRMSFYAMMSVKDLPESKHSALLAKYVDIYSNEEKRFKRCEDG